MDALKILNGANLPLPKQSVAKIYGKTMATQGIAAAKTWLDKIKKDSLNYSLSEDEMNVLGYQFLNNNKDDFAYEVFRTNVELFPSGWNAYDSFGEVLLKMGRNEEAIKMYEKSLVLNPENDNGKKMLEQIRQKL
jgi:tetratricopeptide (TPR) repeat protein